MPLTVPEVNGAIRVIGKEASPTHVLAMLTQLLLHILGLDQTTLLHHMQNHKHYP